MYRKPTVVSNAPVCIVFRSEDIGH